MSDALFDSLIDQLETLKERNRQLEELLVPSSVSVRQEWRLTPSEGRVFAHLASREMGTKAGIMLAMYSDRPGDMPDTKIVDVFVCKLRKKLSPFGVEVLTVWGQGYRLKNRELYSANQAGLRWNLSQLAHLLDIGELDAAQTIVRELVTHLDNLAA